jgi:DNA-binding NarL/FixJ family response regulator
VVRLVLADDHPLIVEGVRLALEADGEFSVVGVASTSSEVLPLVRRTQPQLVVLDLQMPGGGGLVCLERLRAAFPELKVVMLSVAADPALIRAALARGAAAYIIKSIDPGDLAAALRQALEETVFHAIGADPARDGYPEGLSRREVEVLQAIARCGSTQAAAQDLWVSPATVKFHLRNLYQKLGVSSRTAALAWAYDHGLIPSTTTPTSTQTPALAAS